MSGVKTYFAEDVKLIFGTHSVGGFAKGSFITVTELGDGISSEDGADGEVARSAKRYSRFEIKCTLMQTSLSNDFFSGTYALDRVAGQGMLPLTLKDLNGTTNASAPEAWIIKLPESAFADASGNREWTFHTGRATMAFIGGIK